MSDEPHANTVMEAGGVTEAPIPPKVPGMFGRNPNAEQRAAVRAYKRWLVSQKRAAKAAATVPGRRTASPDYKTRQSRHQRARDELPRMADTLLDCLRDRPDTLRYWLGTFEPRLLELRGHALPASFEASVIEHLIRAIEILDRRHIRREVEALLTANNRGR